METGDGGEGFGRMDEGGSSLDRCSSAVFPFGTAETQRYLGSTLGKAHFSCAPLRFLRLDSILGKTVLREHEYLWSSISSHSVKDSSFNC